MVSPIHIVIVDDHQMWIDVLERSLDMDPELQVVGKALNGEDAIRLLSQVKADVVILDIRMPGMSGIELARRIRNDHSFVKILIVSAYFSDEYVKGAVRVGVSGYLNKTAPIGDLIEAIKQISAGQTVLSPEVTSTALRMYAHELNDSQRLTERQSQVLNHLANGLSDKEIGERLTISSRTVETHVQAILSKLGASTRSDAVRRAIENDVIGERNEFS